MSSVPMNVGSPSCAESIPSKRYIVYNVRLLASATIHDSHFGEATVAQLRIQDLSERSRKQALEDFMTA